MTIAIKASQVNARRWREEQPHRIGRPNTSTQVAQMYFDAINARCAWGSPL